MPTYEFQSDDGQHIERFLPMSSPQADGADLVEGGKVFHRLISTTMEITPPIKPYVSISLPKNAPGFRHDSKGRCIVETRKQETAYAKATGQDFGMSTD